MAVPLTKETLEMIEACTGKPLGRADPPGFPRAAAEGTLDLTNVREERRAAIQTLMTDQLEQGPPSPLSPKSAADLDNSPPWWSTGERAHLGSFGGDVKHGSVDSTSVEEASSCGLPSRRPSLQSDWTSFKHKDLCPGLAERLELGGGVGSGVEGGGLMPPTRQQHMVRSRRNSHGSDLHSPGLVGNVPFGRSVARRSSEGNISFARRLSADSIQSFGGHSWKTDSAWSQPYGRVRRNSNVSDLSIPNTDDSFMYMQQRQSDLRSMSPPSCFSGEHLSGDHHGPGVYLGHAEAGLDSPVAHLPGQLRTIRRDSRTGGISSPFCAIPERAVGFSAWNQPPDGQQHDDSSCTNESESDVAGAFDVGGVDPPREQLEDALPLSGVALAADPRTGRLQLHPDSPHSMTQREQLLQELDMHQRAVQQLKESLRKAQSSSPGHMSPESPLPAQRQVLPVEQTFTTWPNSTTKQHLQTHQHSVQAARTAELRRRLTAQHAMVPPPGLTPDASCPAPSQHHESSGMMAGIAISPSPPHRLHSAPVSPDTRQLRRMHANNCGSSNSKNGSGNHGKRGLKGPPKEAAATTLMLQHLSKSYTRDQLCGLLDALGVPGYDFVYLPLKFSTGASFGYAFINFVSQKAAQQCERIMEGFSNWGDGSEEVCTVSRKTTYQGQRACIDLYRNSPVMHQSVGDGAKPAIFCNGVRVEFPPPTKRLKPPRARAAQGPEHASEA